MLTKTINKTRAIAATALLAIASSLSVASAASYGVSGKIPFSFRAGSGETMPAGTYRLVRHSDNLWLLQSTGATPLASLLIHTNSTAFRKSAGDLRAALEFRCAADDCVLAAAFPAGSDQGQAFSGRMPKSQQDPAVKVATVRVPLAD